MNDGERELYVRELCEFIRIPSRSTPGGGEEGLLQAVVADRMRAQGARVRTFEAADIPAFFTHPLCCGPRRGYAGRPTVVAEMGPADAPALLVIAHSDTVPITRPRDWTIDPFGGEIRDGKIHGLGAEDDKWGTAALLAIMRRASGYALRKRLIFASTMDEENGVGNGMLLLMLAGVKAAAGIYLDGNQMKINVGNLGGSFLYLRSRSSRGDSLPARHAAALKGACQAMSRARRVLFEEPLLRDNHRKDHSVILYEMFDENGSYFNVAFYQLPGEDRLALCSQLEAMVDRALGVDAVQYEKSYLEPWFEPVLLSPATPAARCLAGAVRAVLGAEPVITTLSKIDAFVLNNHAGIPTVTFGPAKEGLSRGSFHEPDEYITVEDAWNAARVACTAVDNWLKE